MVKNLKLDDTLYLERISKNLLKSLLNILYNSNADVDSDYRGYIVLENGVICGVPKDTNEFTLYELDSDLAEYKSLGISISPEDTISYNDNELHDGNKIIGLLTRFSDVIDSAELTNELVRLINEKSGKNNIITGNF